jgi:hypothetical protein
MRHAPSESTRGLQSCCRPPLLPLLLASPGPAFFTFPTPVPSLIYTLQQHEFKMKESSRKKGKIAGGGNIFAAYDNSNNDSSCHHYGDNHQCKLSGFQRNGLSIDPRADNNYYYGATSGSAPMPPPNRHPQDRQYPITTSPLLISPWRLQRSFNRSRRICLQGSSS